MDYKIICVKRPLESEPLDEINVNCKRSKLETPFTLPLVTTLKSKEENLAPVIKNIILKCKQEKLQRLQEQKGLSYSDLFKYKTNKLKPRKTTVNSAASSKRYQIVNKRRGLDELDMESRQFLATTDRFKLGLGGSSDCRNDQKSLPSTPDETKNCASSDDGLNIEVLDVDIIPPEEDMICMNGVPLENSFVYDIFLTQVPQGFAAEDFDIYQAANAPVYMPDNDEDDEDGNESEDSNAENFYGNDYPDEESSDDAESDDEVMNSRSRCWDADLSSMMEESLNLASGSGKRKKQTYMDVSVPDDIRGMLDWRKLDRAARGDDDDDSNESSIYDEDVYGFK